jgi:hypothetical protein
LVAALWAWTIAFVSDFDLAVAPGRGGGATRVPVLSSRVSEVISDYVCCVCLTLAMGAFVTAVGVRASLATGSSTSAITITVGILAGAGIAVWIGSIIVTGIAALVVLIFQLSLMSVGWISTRAAIFAWNPLPFFDWVNIVQIVTYSGMTLMVLSESRARFDRIAGRMAGDELQVAVDRALHGEPVLSTAGLGADFSGDRFGIERVSDRREG